MANNQDLQEDFSQDVKDDQHFNGDDGTGENGNEHGTENGNENGNDGQNENDQAQQGEASAGRDDDRLVEHFSFISHRWDKIAISTKQAICITPQKFHLFLSMYRIAIT